MSEVMQRSRRRLLAAMLVLPAAPLWAEPEPRSVVDLYIASDGDNLAFVPNRLSCPAGAKVRLHLHHAGEIIDDPHNWVLLEPGKEGAFLADADKQQDERVIPPGDAGMVIAATPMCPKGETVTVNFIAPGPGGYPFVCSVPGHGETMHGVLTVNAKSR
jgi:azurin